MQKRRLALPVVLLVLVSCGGDADGTPTEPTTPIPTSITLSSSSVTLESLGTTFTVTATVKDQNGATMTGQTVSWSSSDDGVATVSNGTVTSVANGSATITAVSAGARATASAVVDQTAASVEVVLIDPTIDALGHYTEARIQALDANGFGLEVIESGSVTWDSSDPDVAAVFVQDSMRGTIVGLSPGPVTVSATVDGVNGEGEVTVTGSDGSLIQAQYSTPASGSGYVKEDGVLVREFTGRIPKDWAPNGRILYAGATSQLRGLWVAQPDGSNEARIYDAVNDARWSPMGDRIAASAVVNNTHVLFTIDPLGSDFTRLTSGVNPVWAPGGDKLAFVSTESWDQHIMDLGKSQTTPVPGCGTARDWSVDGRYLLCSAETESGQLPELHILDLEGDVTTSAFLAVGSWGAFSPDGKRVVLSRETSANSRDLFIVQISDGSETQLTTTENDHYWGEPRWFRGGN